ncbi:TAF7-like RNA polymerase II TAF7L [Toxoplasma gondii MAS]|uniref:TAF7-like RNA polymerase II TAF7L n=1 Tax=Toxoplasma gondii MAS TaxID=943118 RepID=A0A086QJW0_TOXGO|nr:TAF7-like RNA polymerase II TAF7L [Toxoplasma gondii MAS]
MSYFSPPAEGGTPPPVQGMPLGAPNAFYASAENSGLSSDSPDAYVFAQQSAVMAQTGDAIGGIDPQTMLAQSQVGYGIDGSSSQHMVQAEAYMHWAGALPQQVAPGDPYSQLPSGLPGALAGPGTFPGAAPLPFASSTLPVGTARLHLASGENASVVSRSSRSALGSQRRALMGKAGPPASPSQHQANRELARKQQTALRRGLFLATELEDWMGEDCPGLDRQCIIRFPPPVAALLRKRLSAVTSLQFQSQTSSEALGVDGAPQGPAYPAGCSAANPLGLIITPRDEWSYRIFDVKVAGHKGKLRGVLVELPTLVETYKSLDGDLLFKSGDICQMIVVFDPQDPQEAIDLQDLSERQQWEWKAGLTPPTHRIRSRKFKNLDLFDRQEIRDAELQVLELLHSTRRDNYEIEVHTLHEMHRTLEQQREAAEGKAPKPTAPGATSTGTAVIEHVVSCDDDVLSWLDSVGMLHSAAPEMDADGSFSDYSDVLFDYTPAAGSATAATTNFAARGPGGPRGPRGGRGGAAWQRTAGSRTQQAGAPASQDSLIFGPEARGAPLEDEDGAGSAVGIGGDLGISGAPLASGSGPGRLMGVGPGELPFPQAQVAVEYPGAEGAVGVPGTSEQELETRMRRKEERRQKKLLKKEKRRLKKEKKKAKRDKKKQGQGEGSGANPGDGDGAAGVVSRGQSVVSSSQGDTARGGETGEKNGSSSSSSSDEDEGGRDDEDTLML